MGPRHCDRSLRAATLGACFLVNFVACAGAAPEDGITTNPDAKHDAQSDAAVPLEDSESPKEDTFIEPEDTAVEDTFVALDTSTSDTAELICGTDEWDVDGLASNGCEYKDTAGHHTDSTSYSLGDVSECDSWASYSGVIASDLRLHGTTRASGLLGRPQYITAKHVAKTFCVDDPTFQITMLGGIGNYRVSVYRHSDPAQLDTKCSPHDIGGGETSVEFPCTGQDDGEVLLVKIEKTSGPSEKPAFTFKYHN